MIPRIVVKGSSERENSDNIEVEGNSDDED
jgi:hypothetical protein